MKSLLVLTSPYLVSKMQYRKATGSYSQNKTEKENKQKKIECSSG